MTPTTCKKCGAHTNGTKYDPSINMLKKWCNNCGYTWNLPTVDASESAQQKMANFLAEMAGKKD